MRKKNLFVIIVSLVLIFLAVQQLLSLPFVKKEFRSASLFVRLSNDSSRSFESILAYFYVRGNTTFNFTDTTIKAVSESNATVNPIIDGSGMQLYLESFEPSTSVEFQVDNITFTEIKSDTLIEAYVIADYNFVEAADVSYDAVFALYGRVGFYDLSIASLHTFADKHDEAVIYRTQNRAQALDYLNVFYIVTLAFGLMLLSSVAHKRFLQLPLITTTIILASIFVYVFIGSGYEIIFLSVNSNLRLLFPVAFLIHGFDQHLEGNLIPHFVLVSFLFESWLSIRRRHAFLFWWYLVPLFADSMIGGALSYLSSGRFSFGLSLAIEAMTWTLWAYIIKNHSSIIKGNRDVFFSIIAGIPSFVFLGWLLNLVYQPVQTSYYQGLTAYHVAYGLITMVIVFLAVFIKDFIAWFRLSTAWVRNRWILRKDAKGAT